MLEVGPIIVMGVALHNEVPDLGMEDVLQSRRYLIERLSRSTQPLAVAAHIDAVLEQEFQAAAR